MSGEINWFELPTEDTAKARVFQGELVGWRTGECDDEDDHHVIGNGVPGALVPTTAELTGPRVYFATDDLASSVAAVQGLGGTAHDVVFVTGVGQIAHCRDDQGNPFSLYQPAQPA
ncbi:VOC family protein [Actinosynnema sp. NPDC051121]|nr:VOC family protein [Saccharothrix sp.]